MSNDDFEFPQSAPFWRCDECGHTDKTKPMPRDRKKFYDRVARTESPLCPKCHSPSFMPVGL